LAAYKGGSEKKERLRSRQLAGPTTQKPDMDKGEQHLQVLMSDGDTANEEKKDPGLGRKTQGKEPKETREKG